MKGGPASTPRPDFHSERATAKNSPASAARNYLESGVADASHELRNLLTALSLYSDLLAEPGVLTAPYSHMAEEIKLIAQAGRHLLDTLSRVPVGKATANSTAAGENGGGDGEGMLSRQRLAPVLDSCLPLLAHMAGPRVRVHLKCAQKHGSLPLSQEDLTMILVNLVRNAAEAMPGGGGVWIAIQPELGSCKGGPKFARIVVEDDGPGIPASVRSHVFESGFTTKKASLSSGLAGANERHGLGLAIVRSQVESAGGAIEAMPTSTRGGARFEIRIPVGNHHVDTKVVGDREGKLQRTNHKDEGTRVRC
jgi:signal transduction histidine kinase